jgi:penicillin-binding protein 2
MVSRRLAISIRGLGWCWLIGLLAGCRPAAPTVAPTGILPTPRVAATAPSTPTPLPTPRAAAEAYLSAWQRGDYAGMYRLLAPESQSAISAEDFANQYREVLGTLTADGIAAEVRGVSEGADASQVQVRVRFTTALTGALEAEIGLPLKRTGEAWGVLYSPAIIWPDLVNGQRLYMAPLRPDRGTIYDRNGAPMATHAEAYALGLVPGEIQDEAAVQEGLGRLLGVPRASILKRYEFAAPDAYLPIAEVGADEIGSDFEYLFNLPGLRASPYTARFYYGSGAAAHVTGYTAFIPPDQLADYQAQGYFVDQRVGATGLEAWGEAALAGRNGGQLILLDANGQVLERLTEASQPEPAQDVYTTVDFELQKAVQFALGDFTGAAVVLNRDTGEVLALASSPTFDPNLFEPANVNAQFAGAAQLSTGLFNHAAQGAYPAGSVFKVVTMAAGLRFGLFTPDTTYTCTGVWDELGPSFVLNDWKEGGHGALTLTQGLSASCNPWFWHVGLALFNDQPGLLAETALAFGLGQATGIQIDETPGQIPGPDWKQKNLGQAWTVFDNLNLAIGQGDVLVTPLQIARMMAAVGNGGTLYQPQLVLRIQPPQGAPTFEFEPVAVGRLPLTPEQLAAIQEGLYNVTQEPIGTARDRFRGLPGWLKIAGKTGTAEDPGAFGLDEPDAWFAGYTFAGRPDRPDIAIAVIVANQGQGSDFAAPIFRRIVESYFGLRLTKYRWESEIGVAATPTPTPDPNATETPAP